MNSQSLAIIYLTVFLNEFLESYYGGLKSIINLIMHMLIVHACVCGYVRDTHMDHQTSIPLDSFYLWHNAILTGLASPLATLALF